MCSMDDTSWGFFVENCCSAIAWTSAKFSGLTKTTHRVPDAVHLSGIRHSRVLWHWFCQTAIAVKVCIHISKSNLSLFACCCCISTYRVMTYYWDSSSAHIWQLWALYSAVVIWGLISQKPSSLCTHPDTATMPQKGCVCDVLGCVLSDPTTNTVHILVVIIQGPPPLYGDFCLWATLLIHLLQETNQTVFTDLGQHTSH